jgi:RND family efflux transporter MFP subunit
LLLLSGCDNSEAAANASPPPPPVNVILPVEDKVQQYDEFIGRVAALDSVDIRARVSGYILSIGFKDGDEVKSGQVLFQIDPKPFSAALDQAKAQLGQAQAELSYAQREYDRLAPLLKSGVASPEEVSKAQDQVARGQASIDSAKAQIEAKQLDLDYASVKSPIDGRISKSGFSVGNLIGGDTLLTTVVSINPIYVDINVDERRLLAYRAEARRKGTNNLTNISDAKLPLFVALSNEKDFGRKGVVNFVDNRVDPLTGTIQVRGLFDNNDRMLTPGQFVRAHFPYGDALDLPMIPDRAIARDQDRKYVLVVDDKNIVSYRSVETGPLEGENRSITSGLKLGERVIVDGLQRARPGQPVTPTLLQPTTQPTTSTAN